MIVHLTRCASSPTLSHAITSRSIPLAGTATSVRASNSTPTCSELIRQTVDLRVSAHTTRRRRLRAGRCVRAAHRRARARVQEIAYDRNTRYESPDFGFDEWNQ